MVPLSSKNDNNPIYLRFLQFYLQTQFGSPNLFGLDLYFNRNAQKS